jgi:hypothetical protein
MKSPIRTAMSAAMSTAAAPTSLPTRASGCISGLAKSTSASRAVLTNSAVHTSPMAKKSVAQACHSIFRIIASMITTQVAKACIQALRCVRRTYHQPENACLNALIREVDRLDSFIRSHPLRTAQIPCGATLFAAMTTFVVLILHRHGRTRADEASHAL